MHSRGWRYISAFYIAYKCPICVYGIKTSHALSVRVGQSEVRYDLGGFEKFSSLLLALLLFLLDSGICQ
jgi:hypothetical protein